MSEAIKTTASKFKTIRRSEIFALINGIKKGSFVGITYKTLCGSRKAVEKLTDTRVIVGKNYQDFINKQLEKQGEDNPSFVAQKKKGFDIVDGTDRFIRATKTGKLQLKFLVARNVKPTTSFFFMGKEITKTGNPEYFTNSELKPYTPTIGRGTVKADEKGQLPQFRTVGVNNIKRLTIQNVLYVIVD